ncbi:MAG: glycosyltransferase [Minwuia sp.]|nr:glycosyltransferase [Minwuia sp.]
MLIQFFTLRPVAAVNDIRVHQPAAALARLPGVRCHVFGAGQAMVQPEPGEDSVFVWQRQILDPARADDHLRLLRQGHLVISEWDDDPRIWPQVLNTNYFCLRASHAVQTSTSALGSFIRQHNPHVGVFPNQLASIPPRVEPEDGPGGPVTLFFGALNREPDWQPLIAELNAVLKIHGDRVRVTVVHDRAFFDALETRQKTFHATCPHDRYRDLLGAADIALLPLEDSAKNRLKSDLKFIECAAEGTVALASPVVYEGTIRHNETGLIFRTPRQFGLKLRALIGDRSLRLRLSRAAHAYVSRERRLEDHVTPRIDWYRTLLDQQAQLDAAMRGRCLDIPAVRW